VQIHLRNKNLVVLYEDSILIQKIFNRLSNIISKCFVKIGKPRLIVAEQIIENPLILRNLREKDKTILDFGGFESILPLQLSALGYEVTVLDQMPYPFCHPNLTILCAEIFSNPLILTQKYDVVVSISTIEHLGLGHYGDAVIEDGDRKGVEILWNFLKKGGRLMASVPAGKPTIQRGYRVYNKQRLTEFFPNISSTYWFTKNGREGVWQKV